MQKERLDLLNLVAGNTVEYRLKQWTDNFFANQDDIKGSYGVATLVGALTDVPAILVGSGPCLNYNINQLPPLQNRACIVAAVSALHGLCEAGVKPHITLVTDSKERCLEYLEGIDISGMTFVVDTFAHPAVVSRLKDARRIYWYNTVEMERVSITKILDQYTGYIGKISTGGCGITTGWCFVRNVLKCDPDVLVGLPEAFYDPGSPYNAESAEQYSSLLTKHHRVIQYASPNIEQYDMFGRLVYTKAGFQSFAFWFYKAFVDVPGIHINCTEGGILKENCLNMSLAFCTSRYLKTEYDIDSMLFAKERIADKLIAEHEVDTRYKPFLTWLVDGPSVPTLALRMGFTEPEVAQVVINLREKGVKITETPHSVNTEDGGKRETLVFQLEKESEQVDE